jgi:hypothetical protein
MTAGTRKEIAMSRDTTAKAPVTHFTTVERTSVRRRRRAGAVLAAIALVSTTGVMAPSAWASDTGSPESYEFTMNGQTTELSEGESLVFPLYATADSSATVGVLPKTVYEGNGGTITVTASKGTYYWKVDAPCATDFLGKFDVTDLSNGFGGGSTPATGLSGEAPTSRLWNHRYSGTLSGAAINPIIGPCAVTGPNNTLYKYQG